MHPKIVPEGDYRDRGNIREVSWATWWHENFDAYHLTWLTATNALNFTIVSLLENNI